MEAEHHRRHRLHRQQMKQNSGIIIIVMLTGYALSITVRSRYFQYLKKTNQTEITGQNGIATNGKNEIPNFEYNFENNIYNDNVHVRPDSFRRNGS